MKGQKRVLQVISGVARNNSQYTLRNKGKETTQVIGSSANKGRVQQQIKKARKAKVLCVFFCVFLRRKTIAKASSSSSRTGGNQHGKAQGSNSTHRELASFTLPEPDAFHPKMLQKNVTELMSKALGFILGSHGV